MRAWEFLERFLDVHDAAKLLHLHPNTIYCKARRGELPAVKMYGKVLIDRKQLMDQIESHRIARRLSPCAQPPLE